MQGLDLSPVGLFFEAGLVGKAVMAVLFVASLWCWVLIVEGVISVARIRRAVRGARAGGEIAKPLSSVARRRRGGGAPAHSRRDGQRTQGAHLGRDGARRARAPDALRGRAAQSRRHLLGRAVHRPVRHGLGHHVELRRDLAGATTRVWRPSPPASPSCSRRPPMGSRRRSPPRSATTASAPPTPGSGRKWPPSSRSARSCSFRARRRWRATAGRGAAARRPDGDEAAQDRRGPLSAAGRDQRHAAGRRDAGAAHHLHGDGADAGGRRSRSICRARGPPGRSKSKEPVVVTVAKDGAVSVGKDSVSRDALVAAVKGKLGRVQRRRPAARRQGGRLRRRRLGDGRPGGGRPHPHRHRLERPPRRSLA